MYVGSVTKVISSNENKSVCPEDQIVSVPGVLLREIRFSMNPGLAIRGIYFVKG